MNDVLNFEPSWYIEALPDLKGIIWVAQHRHLGTKRKDGWLLHRSGTCSKCRAKFPTYIVGMTNMMNGLREII